MRSTRFLGVRSCIGMVFCALLAAVAGCSDSEPRRGDDGPASDGRSLFVEGCPVPGQVKAAKIGRPDLGMWGPQVLGEEGDFLLMNDQSAFIITNPEDHDTYWYYGGILVDAVALNGCEQAGPERYEEFWPLAAQLDISELIEDLNFGSASVRGFHGKWAEILNPDSNGEDGILPILRVHGSDDTFWIAEYNLLVESFRQGTPKTLSSPLDVEMFIDYVLPADSPVLRIVVHYRNLRDQPQAITPAAAHLFGSTTEVGFYSLASGSIGGFDFKIGVPWITSTSSSNDGAWAFAMQDATLVNAKIAGVDAVLDLGSLLVPLQLGPAGSNTDTASATFFLGVGTSDGNSAERLLHDVWPRAFPWAPYELLPVSGTTFDAETKQRIAGVDMEVQLEDVEGNWRPLHRFQSDETGAFQGAIADFGDSELEYRIAAHVDGRPDPEPIRFTTSSASNFAIALGSEGKLTYNVRDEQGRSLPARITLWQAGQQVQRIHAADGTGEAPVPPGTYEVSVTRGFEYTTSHRSVKVEASARTPLEVQLDRVVDTSGFLSLDGHMHAAPSPDSPVSIPDRIRTAATEGLEVAASTDHEFIGSWQRGIEETGLGNWVATITGCELTAEIPEHINLLGIPPRFDLDARGGFIRWYQHDIAWIFDAARERGARLITLNHPSYLRLVQYDRLTGRALLDDPTGLGLSSDAQLWSWNFDAIELMNGHENPFVDFNGSRGTGYFDDWMSFLNLGHRITAVGTTDIHGMDVPGQPRTYFKSSTDKPRDLNPDELIASLIAGRALVSDGAFARVRINGTAGLGDLVTDIDGSVDLTVRIEGIPEIDVTHFVVFVNCDQVLKIAAQDPGGLVKYEGTLALTVPSDRDAHVVVAGFGEHLLPRGLGQFDPAGVPRFTTNPIYVDVDGNGSYDPPGGKKTCSYELSRPE